MLKIKKLSCLPALLVGLSACATIDEIGNANNQITSSNSATEINWPEQYTPEKATFYVHNEIDIAASPEAVWNVLVRAEQWPSWYEGALDVKLLNSSTGKIEKNSKFDWNTMGFDFTSVVTEYQPPYRLSWESRRGIIQGYHAWLIIPTNTGSKVITDESQFGLLAHLQPIFVPEKLHRLHDIWLKALKQKAEAESAIVKD